FNVTGVQTCALPISFPCLLYRIPSVLCYFSMSTYELFAHGTDPLTTSTFFSGYTLITRRFCTLTRWLPVCPAIRMPLNTRDGKEAAPSDPGARRRLC